MSQPSQAPTDYRSTIAGVIRSAGHLQHAGFELGDSKVRPSPLPPYRQERERSHEGANQSQQRSLDPLTQSTTIHLVVENQPSTDQPVRLLKAIRPITLRSIVSTWTWTWVLYEDHTDDDWYGAITDVLPFEQYVQPHIKD
ncbi:hypothetical protein BOTBODRAFT_642729 [Botryobasidium botryosum FD-172 SS1]|uniref:Uncharacterized protein n=1 Tax=Botryobasidium botryosum (strain FD-172 SS1) TaxID=930990 RepID=A0A067M156_BOTB1|nr:hypothetical protein BOTBODRAFT_642729 [Botryobasidium botryosum FD-172 SS1]